jgi:hypothetical protein
MQMRHLARASIECAMNRWPFWGSKDAGQPSLQHRGGSLRPPRATWQSCHWSVGNMIRVLIQAILVTSNTVTSAGKSSPDDACCGDGQQSQQSLPQIEVLCAAFTSRRRMTQPRREFKQFTPRIPRQNGMQLTAIIIIARRTQPSDPRVIPLGMLSGKPGPRQ